MEQYLIAPAWELISIFSDCSHFPTKEACIGTGFITKRGTDECFATCVKPTGETAVTIETVETEESEESSVTSFFKNIASKARNTGEKIKSQILDWWN